MHSNALGIIQGKRHGGKLTFQDKGFTESREVTARHIPFSTCEPSSPFARPCSRLLLLNILSLDQLTLCILVLIALLSLTQNLELAVATDLAVEGQFCVLIDIGALVVPDRSSLLLARQADGLGWGLGATKHRA